MIRVMVVDDSPLVRKVAADILNECSDITVAATALNAEVALKKLDKTNPDVITMDIEMPGMGGLKAIEKIMQTNPTPIIVLSAFAKRGAELTLQALDRGAVDFMAKPTISISGGIAAVARELIEKVRQSSKIKVDRLSRINTETKPDQLRKLRAQLSGRSVQSGTYELVAIGTSTGGPVALRTVLCSLPGDLEAGIVVVQHMPPVFTKTFADRLDVLSQLHVKEAEDGDEIVPGEVLIAPGDYHMIVSRVHGSPRVQLCTWEPVSGHRPSVDVLMHSVARGYGSRAIGVIMTGMGTDGAEGMGELKKKGGYIIAQDKETSVIFGMNREVIRNNNADAVVPVQEIGLALKEKLQVHQCA